MQDLSQNITLETIVSQDTTEQSDEWSHSNARQLSAVFDQIYGWRIAESAGLLTSLYRQGTTYSENDDIVSRIPNHLLNKGGL